MRAPAWRRSPRTPARRGRTHRSACCETPGRCTSACTPPIAGARAAVEVEETLDDPRDEDEEWVVEAAIPLAALPDGGGALHARRCDTPKDGIERCGAWDGPLALSRGATAR